MVGQPSRSQSNLADSSVSGGESPADSGGEGGSGSGRGGEGACTTCGGAVGAHGRPVRACPADVEQFIQASIFPREINEKTQLCKDCYSTYCDKGKQKGQENLSKSSHSKDASKRLALSEQSENVKVSFLPSSHVAAAPQPSIALPNYKRASSLSKGCLFPNCAKRNLHIIPQYVKQCLLRDLKLYSPKDCQVCKKHLFSNDWTQLLERAHPDFTAEHIEDLISILTTKITAFNFDNIEDIPPNLLIYCTGFNHIQFRKIMDTLPSLMTKTKTPVLALTAYLTKLRTIDSFDRLSTLFQTTAQRLEELAAIAKECVLKRFGPFGKTEKVIGGTTEDQVLRYLQEQYNEDEGYPKSKEHAEIRSSLDKMNQSRKRKNIYDSDDNLLASKIKAKKRLIEMKVETNKSIQTERKQYTVELQVELKSPERVEAEGVSESSDEEQPEHPRVKEEPDDEGEAGDEETTDTEEKPLVFAPRPTKELQKDPLDTVPAPLLEVKSEEDPVIVKEELEEGDLQAQPRAVTSRQTGGGSFTVYYTKGASSFVQGIDRSPPPLRIKLKIRK